jgi:hypothetical protein
MSRLELKLFLRFAGLKRADYNPRVDRRLQFDRNGSKKPSSRQLVNAIF